MNFITIPVSETNKEERKGIDALIAGVCSTNLNNLYLKLISTRNRRLRLFMGLVPAGATEVSMRVSVISRVGGVFTQTYPDNIGFDDVVYNYRYDGRLYELTFKKSMVKSIYSNSKLIQYMVYDGDVIYANLIVSPYTGAIISKTIYNDTEMKKPILIPQFSIATPLPTTTVIDSVPIDNRMQAIVDRYDNVETEPEAVEETLIQKVYDKFISTKDASYMMTLNSKKYRIVEFRPIGACDAIEVTIDNGIILMFDNTNIDFFVEHVTVATYKPFNI